MNPLTTRLVVLFILYFFFFSERSMRFYYKRAIELFFLAVTVYFLLVWLSFLGLKIWILLVFVSILAWIFARYLIIQKFESLYEKVYRCADFVRRDLVEGDDERVIYRTFYDPAFPEILVPKPSSVLLPNQTWFMRPLRDGCVYIKNFNGALDITSEAIKDTVLQIFIWGYKLKGGIFARFISKMFFIPRKDGAWRFDVPNDCEYQPGHFSMNFGDLEKVDNIVVCWTNEKEE